MKKLLTLVGVLFLLVLATACKKQEEPVTPAEQMPAAVEEVVEEGKAVVDEAAESAETMVDDAEKALDEQMPGKE